MGFNSAFKGLMWGILDKATETKVDAGVEIVKFVSLLHTTITYVEGLHDASSNDRGSLEANGGTQFNKSRILNSVTASAKQTRDLFCERFNSPAGSVPRNMEAVIQSHD